MIEYASDGTFATRYFQNDGHGVFTEVASPAPAPSPTALAATAEQAHLSHG